MMSVRDYETGGQTLRVRYFNCFYSTKRDDHLIISTKLKLFSYSRMLPNLFLGKVLWRQIVHPPPHLSGTPGSPRCPHSSRTPAHGSHSSRFHPHPCHSWSCGLLFEKSQYLFK